VLAMVLLGDEFSPEQKQRNFDYYDPLTTGDSSLSACVQAIVAAEIGYERKALEYFQYALLMDLADVAGNVVDGVHIASVGGVWMALVYGFGGLRDFNGELSFDPRLPRPWTRLAFSLRFHDRQVRIDLTHDTFTFEVTDGDELTIDVRGTAVTGPPGEPVELPASVGTTHHRCPPRARNAEPRPAPQASREEVPRCASGCATLTVRSRSMGRCGSGELLDHLDVLPHTVLVLHDGALVTADHVLPDRRRGGGPTGDLRRSRERAAVRGLPRPGGARGAPAPGGLVHRPLRRPRPPAGAQGDRPSAGTTRGRADVLLRRSPARGGLRRQGLAGAVGRPRHHGLPRRRALRRIGDRGLLAPQSAGLRVVRRGAWAPAARRRPRRRPTATRRPAVPVPRAGRPAGSAGCRSATPSTRSPSITATTSWSPATTSTTRRRRCSATSCAGRTSFLARQRPGPAATGANQVRKVKPLYRLSEREMAAYCVVRGIDYVVEECPWSTATPATTSRRRSTCSSTARPGLKAQFLFGFYERQDRLVDPVTTDDVTLGACTSCGMPTTGEVCAFCRQRELILAALPVATGADDVQPAGVPADRAAGG
jgi:uncharacterized protein (TIGR00269 family)